jgi:transposase-like protein
MKCPKCGSQQCVKAGFNHNRQRCKCKECKYQFTQTTDKNATKRTFALYLYVVGLSMNAIGRMLKVEPSTVLYWVRNFALKTYEKPTRRVKLLLNSMRCGTFCVQKKQGLGREGILSNCQRACGLGMRKPKCPNTKKDA